MASPDDPGKGTPLAPPLEGPGDEGGDAIPKVLGPISQGLRAAIPVRAKDEPPGGSGGQIEIRGSDGSVAIHDLPAAAISTGGPAPARPRSGGPLRDAVRSFSSWVLLLALTIDVLALTLEPIFLILRGAPVSAALATALAAVALSLLVALAAAAPLAAIHWLVRVLGRQGRPWRQLWPLPIALAGWLVVTDVAPHPVMHWRSLLAGQLILSGLFVAVALVAVGISRIRRSAIRAALGACIAVFALALNRTISSELAREPRDLLWISIVLSFAAIFYPARRYVATLAHERVSRWLAVVALVSLPMLAVAPVLSPDWRVYAVNGGRFAPRMARFCRTLIDFDEDGFSPVLWGTDCNDSDPAVQPAIRERLDGIDHNCNGKLRPATSTPAQRGLSPAYGDPDLAPGEIDRVVLVTIDCFRNDSFNPEVTPNLARLAERGVRFSRLYSQGARTAMSLPYVLRGAMESPPLAEILGAEGVSTTAMFGYRHSTLESNVFDGFQVVKRPELIDHRIRAPELTALALADLRDPAHAHAHFLWVHYFDAHAPRAPRVLPPGALTFPPIPGEPAAAASAIYLSFLHHIDAEVGRLIDGIEQEGGLGRTVVIATNDHGEGFGRHGVYAHGVTAFEAITHAPGFILAPALAPGEYAHVLAQRDIPATVLGAFGLAGRHPGVETFGRSWWRLRGAGREEPLHEFVVTYETTTPLEHWADAPMASIVDDHAKLSRSYTDGIERFYDLDRDPGENDELASRRPADVARYRDLLETFRDIDAPPQ